MPTPVAELAPRRPLDPSAASCAGAFDRLHAQLPERVVFFDGVCGFCDRGIRWLMQRDPSGRLHFAPLQGATASQVRSLYPERFPREIDTMVVLDNSGPSPRLLLRSEAAFAILGQIEGPARHWAVLRWLPRFLSDLGYLAFAAIRYRVFGRLDACRIPAPSERARFLD